MTIELGHGEVSSVHAGRLKCFLLMIKPMSKSQLDRISFYLNSWKMSYNRPLRTVLGRETERLAYLGWLGRKNLGDEVLFEAIDGLLEPLKLYSMERREWNPVSKLLEQFIGVRSNGGAILGGGTILKDSYLDRFGKEEKLKAVFGSGLGIDWADFRKYRGGGGHPSLLSEKSIGSLDGLQVGVRGPISRDLLLKMGVEHAQMIGDPALALCDPRPVSREKRGRIGINLGCENLDDPDIHQRHIESVVTKFCNVQIKRSEEVVFFPMSPIDEEIGLRIRDNLCSAQFTVFKDYLHTPSVMSAMKSCDGMVAQRLHAGIIAVGCGVPSLFFCYSPKCWDFLESVHCESLGLDLEELESMDLVEKWDEMLNDRVELESEMSTSVIGLKKRLSDFSEELRKSLAIQ
jgi:hypothetical protein